VAPLLAVLFLGVYGIHRLRYVGDCDSWAYFAQAQIFLGRDPGLHIFPNSMRHPSLTPLGMDVARGHYVSAFPPGYSILMALAGLVTGGEYWVNPVLGALSVVLLYAVIALENRPSIAGVAAALWGVCPLVMMNAADVMSDMAATVAALGSYLLVRRRMFVGAGIVAGLMMMIRPMNVLFLPCVALLLPRRLRAFAEFGGAFALGAALSAAAHWHVWGSLLSPTYHHNAGAFHLRHFVAQVGPYAREIVLHLGPVLALAVLAVIRSPRASLPEAVWLGAFFLVYPFAGPVDIDWTRPRFFLPSFPAAFVLAAREVTDVLWAAHERSARALRFAEVVAVGAAFAWGTACVVRARHIGALATSPPLDPDARTAIAHLPRDALVGTREFSGSLRLYAAIETFDWSHPEAVTFAKAEADTGRPVYMLLEPDSMVARAEQSLIHRFSAALMLDPVLGPIGPGFALSKVVGGWGTGRLRLPLANPTVRWALLDGWLDEVGGQHDDYRIVRCDRASIAVLLRRRTPSDLDVVAATMDGDPPRAVEASIDGQLIGRTSIGSDFSASTFRVPRDLAHPQAVLGLRFPGAPSCAENVGRGVARVRAIETRVRSE